MTSCPSCSASLPADAISESLSAARCPSCRALIDLGSSRTVTARAATVATPERWQVEATPGSLLVRWRWFTVLGIFIMPFALFWNGILAVAAFGVSDGFTHPERLLFGLALPHVWVGLGLFYFALATFVNSTTVRVANGFLMVRIGPLPWRGKRDLPTRDVQQLFVVEKRGNKGSVSYELCALMRDGKRQSVLTGINDELGARFLEVRLEQVMNIVDQAVAGELRR